MKKYIKNKIIKFRLWLTDQAAPAGCFAIYDPTGEFLRVIKSKEFETFVNNWRVAKGYPSMTVNISTDFSSGTTGNLKSSLFI